MIRELSLLALLAVPGCAQFRNLATTDDGSVVLFSTTQRQTDTEQYTWEKVFRVDAEGLHLVEQRERLPDAANFMTNFYRVEGAALSGDGSVLALITRRDCIWPGSSCSLQASKVHTEIGSEVLWGQARLSRNGRYAVSCCERAVGGGFVLQDLVTGTTRRITYWHTFNPRNIVSSTGLVARGSLTTATVALIGIEHEREYPVSAVAEEVMIDDGARMLVYQSTLPGGSKQLTRVDLATGQETPFFSAPNLTLVGLSNDGSTLAFLSHQRLYAIHTDGSGLRLLTKEEETVSEATLSGDGGTAYAVADGAIVKINLETGESRIVVNVSPTLVSNPPSVPVAGSALCASAAHLDATFRLRLDGQPIPTLFLSPTKMCYQIPWGTVAGFHTMTATIDTVRPFEPTAPSEQKVYIQPPYAQFFTHPLKFPEWSLVPIASHDDASPVTFENPAHAGELIHFSMTGLGPVSPAVADGDLPASPSVAILPFGCSFGEHREIDAEIPFAGLASDQVGFYRVSIRMPARIPFTPAGYVRLYCGVAATVPNGGLQNRGTSVIVPVAQ
ncbi:MAG: hypothetical protein HY820_23750 [Acidobacteria bacterium]|nr:hypothetical protein [Acidobacteriota bacterium]